MALLWALAVLSLLPLLNAQNPLCANLTAVPITNATLDLISGKWYYIGSAFRNPQYNESARSIQAAFFFFDPKPAEDKINLREYQTIGNQCIYNDSSLKVHRENGSLSKHEMGREHVADLLLTKVPKTFMLINSLHDKNNVGLSFYADKAEVTPEQMKEFHDAIECTGIHKSEITYTDEKKVSAGGPGREAPEGGPTLGGRRAPERSRLHRKP
ncbi:alpha-1-acid glycoprotein isoform X1 [Sus scrofa]|uniref:Orosomucoid 1 n=2 Tax=Sus scrofa TaxID=9823 RepID=A0A8D0RSL3_PIG|nr:alpha-1-acid glycoprotein isoform X1 [Sus scrofa]